MRQWIKNTLGENMDDDAQFATKARRLMQKTFDFVGSANMISLNKAYEGLTQLNAKRKNPYAREHLFTLLEEGAKSSFLYSENEEGIRTYIDVLRKNSS